MDEIIITLANGKFFSPDNLDLVVLMNLRNLPRGYQYAGVPPHDNYTVLDHSVESVIIGAKYWDWCEEQGENPILEAFPRSLITKWGKGVYEMAKEKFVRFCLMHDWAEAIVGDLNPSLKDDTYRRKEDMVQKAVLNYLGFESELRTAERQDVMKKHLKIVDLISSLWEVKQLVNRGYDSVRNIYGCRKALLEEHVPWQEIKGFVTDMGAFMAPEEYEDN